jgi:Spy/CpxP family protein refolding chaperone
MKQKKRTVIVSSVLGLIMIGAFALFAGNITGCIPDGPYGSRFHPPFGHHGFLGQGLPDFAAQRLDDHVEELGLTEVQKEQYQAIREEFKQLVAQHAARRREFFIQLREAILAPSPDAAFIGTLVKAHAQNIPDVIDSYVDLFLSFYDILDEQQRAFVIQQAQDRFKRFEGFLTSSTASTGAAETAGGEEDYENQE